MSRILMKHPKFDNSSGDAVLAACLAHYECRIESLKLALTQPRKYSSKRYYSNLLNGKRWDMVDMLLLSGVPFTKKLDTMFEKNLKQSLTNRKEMVERSMAKHHAKYLSLVDNARSFSDLNIVTTVDSYFEDFT